MTRDPEEYDEMIAGILSGFADEAGRVNATRLEELMAYLLHAHAYALRKPPKELADRLLALLEAKGLK